MLLNRSHLIKFQIFSWWIVQTTVRPCLARFTRDSITLKIFRIDNFWINGINSNRFKLVQYIFSNSERIWIWQFQKIENRNCNALNLPSENLIIAGRLKCCGLWRRKTKKLVCGMEGENVVAYGHLPSPPLVTEHFLGIK